jgi:hypothetical protein
MTANLFENEKLSVLMFAILKNNFNSDNLLSLLNNTFIDLAESALTN